MRSLRPSRRLPRSLAVALRRPQPLVWRGAEWVTAAVALALLALALLGP